MSSRHLRYELLPCHAENLPGETHGDDRFRVDDAVLGWVELVEVGGLPAHVDGEAERRHVEVEGARVGVLVEVAEHEAPAW